MACSNGAFDTFISKYVGSLHDKELDDIFVKYDKDGNGFIDAKEMDEFLKELSRDELTADQIQKFKAEMLERLDNNNDGKLDKNEIRSILPTEENFLLQIKHIGNKICGVDFVKIWNHYDKNKNNVLEGSEIDGFLADLILKSHPKTPKDDSFQNTVQKLKYAVLQKFKHGDKLNKADLFNLLRVEAICPEFKEEFLAKDFDTLFDQYDKDKSGEIDEDELPKFLSALHLNSEEEISDEIKDVIMTKLDKNNDKKVQKSELREYLGIRSDDN